MGQDSDKHGVGVRTEAASPGTTIVGNHPPEGGPSQMAVPTGIQQLLRLAASSPAFLELLLRDRAGVAPAAGVSLTASENAVIAAVSGPQLQTMVGSVPQGHRQPVYRQAAAAAVLALGGAGLGGCDLGAGCVDDAARVAYVETVTVGGAAPDIPQPLDDTAVLLSDDGAQDPAPAVEAEGAEEAAPEDPVPAYADDGAEDPAPAVEAEGAEEAAPEDVIPVPEPEVVPRPPEGMPNAGVRPVLEWQGQPEIPAAPAGDETEEGTD